MLNRRLGVIIGWSFAVCAGASACGGGGGASPTVPSPPSVVSTGDGTLLLQNLPIDPAAVDYAFVVSRRAGRDPDWRPLEDFGRLFPGNSANPTARPNPQPTFYAPLGTRVLAVVTGTVTSIPTLYSNDFSVMIGSPGQGGTWEHEHVINVRVNVGDRVTAGQHIADVSNFECVWGRNNSPDDPLCQSGLGLIELGLLYSGNPPNHRCPFEPDLVDSSRRSTIFSQLDSARSRIKAAMGDPNLFGESAWATPQCVSLARVAG